ncbi:hypothetical protein ACFV7Q_34005 [Streptomyces sp. NPDC059851]|uniref:hypothetical protein n=1 Tax=Streptomyces sp. NPDC059851 TaxID=3346971 RepID=UPI003658E918
MHVVRNPARNPLAAQAAPTAPLTDRDERALAAAVEDRVCEPLRLGAVVASLRRTLWRTLARPPHTTAPVQGRESLPCQPTPPRAPSPVSPGAPPTPTPVHPDPLRPDPFRPNGPPAR